MFDIGFWELTVIAIVALLVVGPEELPTLARTTGRWINKARNFMGEMKDELESEVDRGRELKERIVEETKIAEAHRSLSETTRAVSAIKRDLNDVISGDVLKPIPKEERDRMAAAEADQTDQASGQIAESKSSLPPKDAASDDVVKK
ncbi:MAG: twin-arginine translocase subunit TatB [Thiotrichaceae bacterium]|nr:twin-arginine translocase subunit TatB [Thiotrichaceae bacterium]